MSDSKAMLPKRLVSHCLVLVAILILALVVLALPIRLTRFKGNLRH